MTDKLTPEQRHKCMSRIRGKNTKPEIIVRKYLFSRGYRFRIHVKQLPGHPDLVLPKYKTIIFINGCFWHGHIGCKYAVFPKTHIAFWKNKIIRNRERDLCQIQQLQELGWHVIVLWECELKPNKWINTLRSLEYTLNKNFLNDRKIAKEHTNTYEYPMEEPCKAAESIVEYKKTKINLEDQTCPDNTKKD